MLRQALLSSAIIALAVGCSGSSGPSRPSSPSAPSPAEWSTLEARVAEVCACADVACVDRASAGWDELPWPDLRGTDRETHDRTVALADRGNRCQIQQRAREDLDQFAAWATRTCACTDAACADAVDDEVIGWFKKMEHEPVRGRILVVGHDSLLRLDACHAAVSSGAAPAPARPAAPLPDDVAARIAATAELMCACSTMACAELADHELVEWIDLQYHRAGEDPTTGMVLAGAPAANARYQQCHDARATKWPHRSRILESYGIEP